MTEDNHDALIARTSSYALKAQQAFDNTMAEIMRMVRLSRLKPDFQNGQMYSFREEPALRQARVEQALRRLQSIVVTAAERGIALEWQRAEADMTELMNSVYGADAAAAIRAEDKGRNERNSQARQAFIARTDRGANLSSRVWQSCAQMRDQMEMAITVALGDGTSAQEASRDRLTSEPATLKNVATRDIRKYLNDPDLCFRRFRYKDQNGVWSRKWKKRIRDPRTGRVTWQDWDRDSYIPQGAGSSSRGVYKSAYKNAARVTRTETNMAYRNADYEQWLNNPNVLGIHIEPFRGTKKSKAKGGKQIKHIPDICDKLAGDYPKTFRFEGWHPQCYCTVTPILISKAESDRRLEAALKGEPFTPTEEPIGWEKAPEDFRRFVAEHRAALADPDECARLPYFMQHNAAEMARVPKPQQPGTAPAETLADTAGLKEWIRKKEEKAIREMSDEERRQKQTEELRAENLTQSEQNAIAANIAEIETVLGIVKGKPMTAAEADKAYANPNYNQGGGYKTNCVIATATYMLRRRGFDIKAKPNVKGELTEKVSFGYKPFRMWLNPDGSQSKNVVCREWAKKKGYNEMNAARYSEYINENTKEEGVYLLTIEWQGGTGHATIVERRGNGKLLRVEPQNGNLINNGLLGMAEIYLCASQTDFDFRGIMRIDNKIFDTRYCSVFEL